LKKLISSLLSFIIISNSCGLLLYYCISIQLCKIKFDEEINSRSYLNEQSLCEFSADSKGFQLLNEKEFKIYDKHFDIVKRENYKGKTIFYAVSDEKEDAFTDHVIKIEKNNTGSKSLPAKSNNQLLLIYFSGNKDFYLISLFQLNKTSNAGLADGQVFYQSPFMNIFSPPPNNLNS
jgi:hypothetical protein